MLFDRPCPAQTLILTSQLAEFSAFVGVEVCKGPQPSVFRPLQSRSFKSLVTHHRPAREINGLRKVCRDMKLVKDDLTAGIGNMRNGRLEVGLPHVHCDGLDPSELFARKPAVEGVNRFALAASTDP